MNLSTFAWDGPRSEEAQSSPLSSCVTFKDVDFERFREESRWLLATLGSVKAGNLMRKPDGSIVFLARLNHDRRSTQKGKPRPEFPVAFLEPKPSRNSVE